MAIQTRLKQISGIAIAGAVVFGVGAMIVAKSYAVRGMVLVVVLVAVAVSRIMVAAARELAAAVEAQQEETARARNKQMEAMQEQKGLQERWRQMEFFSEVLRAVASLRDVDSVLDAILDRVMGYFGAQSAFAVLGDPDEGDLYIEHAKAVNGQAVSEGRVKWGEGIYGRVALTGEPVLTTPGDTKVGADKGTLMCVPLVIEGRSIGCLTVEQRQQGTFTRGELEFLSLIGQETSLAIERGRLYSQMEQMSITDPLTKLSNRRYLDSRLTEELARAQRHQRPLSIIMLDIDHFKNVNDTHGHSMGDTVLQGVSAIIREQARSTDLPARYGGEEFLIVSTDTTRQDAVILAERLRAAIEQTEFQGEGENAGLKLKITISLGVASFPEHALAQDELVEQADGALYRAKETGRNQVCSAGDQ